MANDDLISEGLAPKPWTPGKTAEALENLRTYVLKKGSDAITWYYDAKAGKKRAATAFRVGIILLTAAAGVLPMLNEIYQSRQIEKQITSAAADPSNHPAPPIGQPIRFQRLVNPGWSAVLLAVAATLLALDRFHGATSGWVRYLLSAGQLTEARDDFELAFEAQKLEWAGPEPSLEQTRAAIELIRKFVKQLNSIVGEETKTWAAEFTEVLKQIEEQTKLASQAKRQSAIQITVTNGDQCTPKVWRLAVGNSLPTDRIGKEASLEVSPGLCVVRVTGELNGKSAQAEKAVNVSAGEIQRVELTLA